MDILCLVVRITKEERKRVCAHACSGNKKILGKKFSLRFVHAESAGAYVRGSQMGLKAIKARQINQREKFKWLDTFMRWFNRNMTSKKYIYIYKC